MEIDFSTEIAESKKYKMDGNKKYKMEENLDKSESNISDENNKRVKMSVLPGLSIDHTDNNVVNLIKYKNKIESVLKDYINSDEIDSDEVDYIVPYNLFSKYQCDTCAQRFINNSLLFTHVKIHERINQANRMMKVKRRGLFNFNNSLSNNLNVKDNSDKIHLNNLLNQFVNNINNTVNTQHFYLSKYKQVNCNKCNKRIRVKYDDGKEKWYLDEGVEITKERYIHKGCGN